MKGRMKGGIKGRMKVGMEGTKDERKNDCLVV